MKHRQRTPFCPLIVAPSLSHLLLTHLHGSQEAALVQMHGKDSGSPRSVWTETEELIRRDDQQPSAAQGAPPLSLQVALWNRNVLVSILPIQSMVGAWWLFFL